MFDAIFSHCEDTDIDEFIKEKESIIENLDDINISIKRKFLDINAFKNKLETVR